MLKFFWGALLMWGAALAQGAPNATSAALPAGISRVQAVEGVTEYRLANGLQLLLIPDDSKPTTTVNLTVHVGSRHENYGETGMAHLLEHMLFKGSPTTRNPWAEFTRRGLRANGSTWVDRTNYFASFAANDNTLKWYLGWQADAMVNSTVARKDLDTEMTVVRNEMEMGENNAAGILFEKTLATMYQWHNYGNSTIGARADVENVDIPRLQAFYRLHYQPDNATLIVAGKFDPPRVLGWVAQSFGRITKPKRRLPRLYTVDAVQDGERSVTLRRSGGTPVLMAGYHLPSAAAPDFAAAEVLGLVLGEPPAGRLHKRLVEGQLAASVFAEVLAWADPSAGLFGAELAPGQDLDKARSELLAVLEGFADAPVTADEVQRAQNKWLKNWELRFSNPETVGVAMSEAIAAGDWRLFFLLRDRVRAVTPADVQRVATQRLLAANRTLGTYVPTDAPRRAPAPERVDMAAQMKSFVPQASADSVPAFDSSPAHIESRTDKFVLSGGMKAALLAKPTRGQAVRITLSLQYGDEASLFGLKQVESMVAAMFDKGSAELGRQQIQDQLDRLKTVLSVRADDGGVTATLQTRREHAVEAVALVGHLLRTPAFPADALDELKRQALAQIEQQRSEPEAMVDNALDRHGNPYRRGDLRYARGFDEIASDIQALTVQQLRDFHGRFYGASQAQFAAVGDFDAAALRAALESAFGGWRSPAPYTRIPEPAVQTPPARLVLQAPDKQNAVLGLRQSVALTENDADYPAFSLANFMLGSGGNSRLWKRIREREGLSYGTWSSVQWNPFERNSMWQAGAIFAPQNRDRVEQGFSEEIARALKDGFSADEVNQSKQALLNFRRLSRAQDEALAGLLARNLYLDRTMQVSQKVDDALAAMTPEQANAALRRYLDPARFAAAVAGDFKP